MADQRIELSAEYTGIALAYKNKKCIADQVFNTVKTNTTAFKYMKYPRNSFLALPETVIGETGEPNRLDLKGKKVTAYTESHALEAVLPVSVRDENARSTEGVDVGAVKTLQLTSALQARKEINLSNLLSDKANYGTNYTEVSKKISDDSVDAFNMVIDAMDEVYYKPNRMVLSRAAFSKLRRNPYVVKAVHKNSGDVGAATLEEMKEMFELDEILVGESVVDTSKNPKSPQLEACWQNDIILMYIDPLANLDGGLTFGFTAEYEPIAVGTYFDGRVGTKGADVLKAYMSYTSVTVCPECGYLLKGVI